MGGGWRGHDGPLVNMQLEPPVQAAGENHSAGLPGEKAEIRNPWRYGRQCLERGFPQGVHSWDLHEGQVPTREVREGGTEILRFCDSDKLPGNTL